MQSITHDRRLTVAEPRTDESDPPQPNPSTLTAVQRLIALSIIAVLDCVIVLVTNDVTGAITLTVLALAVLGVRGELPGQ